MKSLNESTGTGEVSIVLPQERSLRLRSWRMRHRWLIAAVLIFAAIAYGFFLRAPSDFPVGRLVSIERGTPLSQIAEALAAHNIVSSATLFTIATVVMAGQGGIISGDYFLNERQGLLAMTWRLTSGDYALTPIAVTFPEGATVAEMARIAAAKFPEVDASAFEEMTRGDEGYLFPDTYYFLPNVRVQDIVRTMRETFDRKVAPLASMIAASGYSLRDIVIMASLLEEEARTTKTRRTIAGILWKRLAIGMPLQVDAVFPYIIGKNTYEVTLDDLQVDSPYNTYKYKGLPPGPITNPGIDSIEAALNPIETSYLYYLSDDDGEMHYARTFEEHKVNKTRYLY